MLNCIKSIKYLNERGKQIVIEEGDLFFWINSKNGIRFQKNKLILRDISKN